MEDSSKKRSFNKNRKSDGSGSGRKERNLRERTEARGSRPYKSRYQEVEEKIKRRRSDSDERDSDSRNNRSRSGTDNRNDRSRKKFTDREDRPHRKYNDGDDKPRRSFGERDDKPRRSFTDREDRPRRKYNDGGDKPRRSFGERDDKPRRSFNDREDRPRRKYNDGDDKPRRSFGERDDKPRRSFNDREDRPRRKYDDNEGMQAPKRKRRDVTAESAILSEIVEKRHREGRAAPQKQKILSLEYEEQHGPIRLNKYISNSGICSRRDADVLIESGAITVNGNVVTELGAKVMPTDEVRFEDKILQREKPVYILLNKPKDYITTTHDERDRLDVMELIRGACKERVYPVGRLDKNTTGVLLFTNDGEMAKKLTHPKHNIRKTYHVELDKKFSIADFDAILNGIELDDGMIKADELAYVGDTKKEIGITIHSGRNRIVRRIFEKLGYEIVKLDRVIFAGLDKKNVLRGKWRFLTQAEVNILKMLK